MEFANSETAIPIEKFFGTWFVFGTTLSFWKTRQNPTITYEELPSSTPPKQYKIRDTVRYTTGSSLKKSSVVGTDTWESSKPTDFFWRGDGVLFLLSSKCKIVYFNAEEGVAITFFEKTFFTDEGMDILTRSLTTLSPDRLKEIIDQLPSPYSKYKDSFFTPEHSSPK